MASATIKLVDPQKMIEFYTSKDQAAVARRLLKQDAYTIQGTMGVPNLEGEDVAEEIFDLTNNPSRQDERDELYGHRYRSVSVGDIIRVDGVNFLCASMGWQKLA